jgi:hypothetical protein
VTNKVKLLALLALVCAAVWSASGCIVFEAPQYECRSDKDCAGQCSDVGVCVARGESRPVRLSWSVAGQEISTSSQMQPSIACAGVEEMEVRFSGDGTDSTFPVDCQAGQVYFPRMPSRYDQATVTAYGKSGAVIGSAQASLSPRGPNILRVDVQP